jgi:hypothetical protein
MTKTQPEQEFDSGNRNILELRISCAQLKVYEDSRLKISNQCQGLEQFDIQLGIKR